LNFFKAVRNVINKRTPIIVALTGKAGEGDKLVRQSLFSPVEQSDFAIWKSKLSAVADPWLTVEKVV
ncbi:MAG: hypothetical protein AB7U45_01875, partial [Desulfamplus sp.]